MVILEARGVCFRYAEGTRALDGLDLAIREGETLAVLGPNGAGKTTLLLHLNGSLRPERGDVHLDGAVIGYDRRSLTRWRAAVGLVLQDADDQLFAGRVCEDVSFGPLNLGLGDAEVRARVDRALADVGADHLAERPIHALSLGQKRRVAIAGVLAMQPRVLVLDEPTAGLDPQGVEQLLAVLGRLKQQGTTIVYTSHDVDLALAWSDRVAVFRDGRVLAEGTPATVLDDEPTLAAAHLRRPLLLQVADAARAAGVLDRCASPPRSAAEFGRALRGSCRPGLAG